METAKRVYIFMLHVTVIMQYVSSNDWKTVCYFNAKARHRAPSVKFDIYNIDFNLCTHYVYAYARVDPQDLAIAPNDPQKERQHLGGFQSFTGKNMFARRQAKTLLSIGGPEASAHDALVEVTKSVDSISTFAYNAVSFLRWYGFNGLDIDWQFPTTAYVRAGFVKLLKELRHVFDKNNAGEKLLLTVKCPCVYSKDGYDVPSISRYVDFVVIAAYNLPTPDPTQAWFGSPLYSMPITVESCVRKWLTGLPANKTVVGITSVGSLYTLADGAEYKPGSSILSLVVTRPQYNLRNALAYPEICEMNNSKVFFDDSTKMHYMVLNNTWIGYEDFDSIREKIAWMKYMNLSGVMVAELDMDDFLGTRCHRGPFPFMQIIKHWSDTIESGPTTTDTTTTMNTTTTIKEGTTQPKVTSHKRNTNENSSLYKHLATILTIAFVVFVLSGLTALCSPRHCTLSDKQLTDDWVEPIRLKQPE